MRIVTRAEWGASPWTTQPSGVPLSERTEFYIHYDGATPVTRTGNAVPKQIEAEHLGNRWSGIGYNFVVDQAGTVFEGRGWGLQGAHCPDHNRSAFGVQIAVGGDQAPSAAALRSARDLYEEASSRVGRRLAMHGHKDGYATLCPGDRLYPWVQAGMPYPTSNGDDMPLTDADIARVSAAVAAQITGVDARDNLAWANRNYSGDGHASLVDLLESTRSDLAGVRAALDTVLEAVDGIDTAVVTAALSGAVREAASRLDVHITGGPTPS